MTTMTHDQSQVERMEKELLALRDIFENARIAEDAARMMSLSRVIIQIEKEISKQRIVEGITLERSKVNHLIDQIIATCVNAGQRVLPKDLYDKLIDAMVADLLSLWENDDA